METMDQTAATPKASTIPEFCKQHRFSVAMFYKLKQAGKAPRITSVGARRIITDEDAADWRKAMSEASQDQAA
jgi:hypothetical protein